MIEAKDSKLAFEILDSVVAIAPELRRSPRPSARNPLLRDQEYSRRTRGSGASYSRGSPGTTGALTGLGVILQEIGEDKRALEAFRPRALAGRSLSRRGSGDG